MVVTFWCLFYGLMMIFMFLGPLYVTITFFTILIGAGSFIDWIKGREVHPDPTLPEGRLLTDGELAAKIQEVYKKPRRTVG